MCMQNVHETGAAQRSACVGLPIKQIARRTWACSEIEVRKHPFRNELPSSISALKAQAGSPGYS